jgi:hypothetical protein
MKALMAKGINRKGIVQPEACAGKMGLRGPKLFLRFIALCFFAAGAYGQTTAFTFQGRLDDNGTPAHGNYDLQLKLFNTATVGSGTQVGSTLIRSAIPVTSGAFTVELDFGANAFPGADRFLEVGVKPAGSSAAYSILSPRQPITPTPYALHSLDATAATHATTSTTATTATTATNATSATNSTKLGGVAANQYVLTTDSRLSNPRAPTAGSANYIQNGTAQQPSSNFNISGNGTLLGKLSVGQATPNTYPFSVVGETGTGENQAAAIFSNNSPDTGVTIKNTTSGGAAWTLFSSGTGSVLDSFPSPTPVPGFGKGYFSIYDVTAKKPRLMIDPLGTVFIPSGLDINTTAYIAVSARSSGGDAVFAECLQADNNCYALEASAPSGDYAGYMYGGKGVYAESRDAADPGLHAVALGDTAYALQAQSATYRAGYFKSDNNTVYSLYVDSMDGANQGTPALDVVGTIRAEGDIVAGGSKAGYVVDIMQNADNTALERGDVVVIVGNSAPVLGEIPVITVKKAASAYDTGVVGVVDKVWSAPDPATKAAYEAQESAVRAAMNARTTTRAEARLAGAKPEPVPMPERKITDEQGILHALPDAANVGTGGYVSVVTLGAYKMVKVDASLGAIQPGDLLTTSTTPGYAMKATPTSVNGVEIQRSGAIIGKALDPLAGGKGVIKVFVTLR